MTDYNPWSDYDAPAPDRFADDSQSFDDLVAETVPEETADNTGVETAQEGAYAQYETYDTDGDGVDDTAVYAEVTEVDVDGDGLTDAIAYVEGTATATDTVSDELSEMKPVA